MKKLSYNINSGRTMKETAKPAIYRRTERACGFDRITEVTEAGRYEQRAVWPDGMVTSRDVLTIQEMGWTSVKAFLQARPGFVRVDE